MNNSEVVAEIHTLRDGGLLMQASVLPLFPTTKQIQTRVTHSNCLLRISPRWLVFTVIAAGW